MGTASRRIALIFGLLPIVQASQVCPLAMLRELPKGARTASRLSAVLVLLLLGTLYFGLAFSILQNILVALGLVIGAGIALDC